MNGCWRRRQTTKKTNRNEPHKLKKLQPLKNDKDDQQPPAKNLKGLSRTLLVESKHSPSPPPTNLPPKLEGSPGQGLMGRGRSRVACRCTLKGPWFGASRIVWDVAFLLTVGSFLLTVELSYLQLTILAFLLTVGAFLLTVLASLLTVEAFLLTVGKCI